jgi:putative transferase (TIGR04331 family)
VLKKIFFRPHCEDHGWNVAERIIDSAPDIQIESWDVPFKESMENCRLYVCDHLATTFAEALAANKPTILFCSPRTNPLRPAAQPYFDLLREGGILFDEPEAAAKAATVIYEDVEVWWNLPQRQEVVRIFCDRFARTSSDDIDLWSNELRRVSNLPNY